ncbi:MAG: hypothetical protein ACLR6O_00175 [Eubacterium sp.]
MGEFMSLANHSFSYDTIHDPKYLMTNYRDLNGTVKADKAVRIYLWNLPPTLIFL